MSNLWERIKSGINEIVKSRVFMVVIFFCILSAILVQRVFYLQIVKGQEYADRYELQIQKTRTVEGTRGNIYDRGGNLLAYNELAYSVTIEDTGEYDSTSHKNEELNKVISTVIGIVESNGDKVISDFGIILDNDGNYIYVAESDAQRLRFIADIYGKRTIEELSDEQKGQSAGEVIDYLCTDKVYGYGIDQEEMSREEVLKLINIRYAISLNSYQKFLLITIAEDVSEKTVADIMENMDTLQGVSIEETSLRRYNDSYCFSNIIGYTGQISNEEYDALSKEQQKEYDKTDTVGKSGIEKEMDSTLKGKKGKVKLYVNNVGKIIDTVSESESEAGDNLYLSIDANLQRVVYHIIEQELAGILLAKIQNALDYDRTALEDGNDVIIPIGDVYNSFIENGILDMNHFFDEEAGAMEQEVASILTSYRETRLSNISDALLDPGAPAYGDMSREMQAYMLYIINDILTSGEGVLMTEAIDAGDETYRAWTKEESINIYEYLSYAISKNWIDTSKLQDYVSDGGKYSDSGELYQGLVEFVLDCLRDNTAFDKLLYRYMIRSGTVTGRQLCLILYEQGALEYDEAQYNALLTGETHPYDFVRGKIQTLELTPGQLALEPCTGSMVITDPDNGQVLACVSYPGYDNNRLANTMDSAYYNQLVTAGSRPFYNSATQEKTAPGSTYKMVSAAATLTEGLIAPDETVYCQGTYGKVEPNPKCWIHPYAHGSVGVEGAIEHSCNCYFYEAGYRMGLDAEGLGLIGSDGTQGNATEAYYSSDRGIGVLTEYAEMFGLGAESGLEIPEAEPQISDQDSVRSAIGQGTNNYTVSQLARYVTAVANRGTVYNLTLLDKVTDLNGDTIEEFKPEARQEITKLDPSTWESIHNGMREVVRVENSKTFTELNRSDVQLYGKTGSAQQSKAHADHALFVGFSPSEDPDIAFATRIANGYSSVYTCEVARDIMKYYYGLATEEELVTGVAAEIQVGVTSGD